MRFLGGRPKRGCRVWEVGGKGAVDIVRRIGCILGRDSLCEAFFVLYDAIWQGQAKLEKELLGSGGVDELRQ